MKFLTVLVASLCITLVSCSSVTKVGKFTWSITIDEPAAGDVVGIPDPAAGEVPADPDDQGELLS